jgi:hypothetical protein
MRSFPHPGYEFCIRTRLGTSWESLFSGRMWNGERILHEGIREVR